MRTVHTHAVARAVVQTPHVPSRPKSHAECGGGLAPAAGPQVRGLGTHSTLEEAQRLHRRQRGDTSLQPPLTGSHCRCTLNPNNTNNDGKEGNTRKQQQTRQDTLHNPELHHLAPDIASMRQHHIYTAPTNIFVNSFATHPTKHATNRSPNPKLHTGAKLPQCV